MKNFLPSNLKHLRLQSGMTQTELGKKINKDYSTIGKWELGERSPSTFDLFCIADIFNVSERDIVNKDLSVLDQAQAKLSQQEILFNKTKDHLTESDWNIINAIVEQRKKEIDKELGNDNG